MKMGSLEKILIPLIIACLAIAAFFAIYLLVAGIFWGAPTPEEVNHSPKTGPGETAPALEKKGAFKEEKRGKGYDLRGDEKIGPAPQNAPMGGAVCGTVKCMETGEPVEDFQVSFSCRKNGSLLSREFSSIEGLFHIDFLKPEKYNFQVAAQGYLTHKSREIELKKGSFHDFGIIQLRKYATLSGRVLSHEGHVPLEGVKVFVRKEEGGDASQASGYGEFTSGLFKPWLNAEPWDVTGKDGYFRAGNLEPGTYTLKVYLPGYTIGKMEHITLSCGQRLENIDFLLSRGGTIRGQVQKKSGEPVENAILLARSPELGTFKAKTDKQGYYEFSELTPGTYFLLKEGKEINKSVAIALAIKEDGTMGDPVMHGEKVQIEPGQTVVWDFFEEILCTVKGRISGLEPELCSCIVTLHRKGPASKFPNRKRSALDSSFHYEISGVSEGIYVLSVEVQNTPGTGPVVFAHTVLRKEISVPSEPELFCDISLTLGSISGKVLAASGETLPGVKVKLEREAPSPYSEGVFRTETDPSGRFKFSCLSPGFYRLSAKGNGLQGVRTGISLEGKEEVTGIDLLLLEGGSLEVSIIDETTGEEISFCFLTIKSDKLSETKATHSPDMKTFLNIPPGTYTLSASSPRHEKKAVTVTIPGGKKTRFTLALTPK